MSQHCEHYHPACPHSCKHPLLARAFWVTWTRWVVPWWDDHGSLVAEKVSGVRCHMCRHSLLVTLSKGSHRARRSCCTCRRRQDQEVCTPGPHVTIPPSCCGDMWHHRSKVQGLSEGSWQTFKDGDWGTFRISEGFRKWINSSNNKRCMCPRTEWPFTKQQPLQ